MYFWNTRALAKELLDVSTSIAAYRACDLITELTLHAFADASEQG